MQLIRVRRVAAGLAVAAAVLAAAPAPVSAAPRAAGVSMYVSGVTVPVGAADGAVIPTLFRATAERELQQPTMTYELVGGLTGVTLQGDSGRSDCENESPAKLVCASPFSFEVGPDLIGSYFDAYVKAAADGAIGASGTIRVTFSARGLAPITGDARIRVAESIDLTAGPAQRVTAGVGESFDAPLVVSVTGEQVLAGASVVFDDDRAIESTESYRNCRYLRGVLLSCTFEQSLAAGKTYAASMPMRVRADTRAPGEAHAVRLWRTAAEQEDNHFFMNDLGVDIGNAGSGDDLTLVERSGALKVAQGDPHPEDNWGQLDVRVTGTNGVDLAAVGAELTGEAGAEVTLPVGARNVGKATLDRHRFGSPAAVTAITVPDGTTVVGAPRECFPVVGGRADLDAPGKPGAAKYECHSGSVFVAGTAEIHEFKLRLDRITAGAQGSVAVNEPCECDVFRDDIDKSNNKALIVITEGTGGGEGGGLPVTGPAGMALAGAGVALLVLGVAAFRLGRRRPSRFLS